jgi:hypothetical protein
MDKKLISTEPFWHDSDNFRCFRAHALKKILPAEQLVTFEGVRYQMYHALF